MQIDVVAYNATFPAGYVVPDIASIDVTFGNTRWTEPLTTGRATIRFHYAEGFVTPNPDLGIGNQIDVWAELFDPATNTTNSQQIWSGIVTDNTINYGVPFVDGKGFGDELVVEAAGYISEMNNDTANLETGSKTLDNYTDELDTENLITFFMPDTLSGRVNPSSQQLASFIDAVRYTYAMNVYEGPGYLSADYGASGVLETGFSDEDNNAYWQVYESIEFKSAADEYYTKVTITPQDAAAQTYDSGNWPVFELNLSTISPNTQTALAAAQYYANCLSFPGIAPNRISIRAEAQAVPLPTLNPFYWQGFVIGSPVALKFRGETYACRIVGAQLTATPETSLWTYNLTDASNGNVFILDDAGPYPAPFNGFGALDENRLGIA